MTEKPMNDDALLDEIGAAFFRLRRRTRGIDAGGSRKDLNRNLVLNLLPDGADREVTVGDIAEQLGVDPSMGSRMVSDCIEAGVVRRAPSQADGRRAVLQITPEGERLRDAFRREQRAVFEDITRAWPAGERLEFARLLVKYTEDALRWQQGQ